MSQRAIDEIQHFDEHRNMLHLADAQAYFVRHYGELLPNEKRSQFERELAYLIHLTYREAQLPLTKQLTDVIMLQNRPIVFDKL